MKPILMKESVSNNLIVVKVNPDLTPLDIAMNPWIDSSIAYISLKRGKNKVMTFIRHDGSTQSISFGENGHTLISDALDERKHKVLNFIIHEMKEFPSLTTEVKSASLYFNPYSRNWQLTIESHKGEREYVHLSDCAGSDAAILDAGDFVRPYCWTPHISETGIKVWEAQF